MKTSKVDFGLNEFLVYFALNFGDKCVIELVLYLIKDEMLGVSIDDELKNKEEDIETNENELNENKNLIWEMNKNLKEAEEEFIKTENSLKKANEGFMTANANLKKAKNERQEESNLCPRFPGNRGLTINLYRHIIKR